MERKRSYSLALLFVLITICAVLAASVAAVSPTIAMRRWGIANFAGATVASGFMGLLLGAIVGLYHLRRGRGVVFGALAGLVVGITVGPMPFVRPDRTAQLLVAQITGSVVLVAVSAVLRYAVGIRRLGSAESPTRNVSPKL